jgi:hypothetical protein
MAASYADLKHWNASRSLHKKGFLTLGLFFCLLTILSHADLANENQFEPSPNVLLRLGQNCSASTAVYVRLIVSLNKITNSPIRPYT